jgi:CDP-6-deoxy-D-xylo-4-hexulose-3-dehydrase
MFYELAASSWGEEEVDALHKVIESGFFTMGQHVAAFENEFSAYFGKRYGVMVNSGSSANLIAVASLFYKKHRPLKPGDEVIVPAISWATTYTPLMQYGLKLKFVDVDLHTLNMACSDLESAITENTRMIVGVSILGNPASLDMMRALADKHQLYFLEDNCESMDANLNGQKTGTFGDLNTFSFFFSHHISTMEGGMILTDDAELYELAVSLRAHGWTRGLPENSILYDKGEDAFAEAYRFILPGYNVRPTELNAAVGREQLKKLPAMTAQRRKNWRYFQQRFQGDDRFIIQQENGESSAFCFTIILNTDLGIDRAKVFAALTKADIGFRMITGGNFLRHDVIKYADYSTHGEIIHANTVHDHGFFVGNHPYDLREQIDTLYRVLDEATL